MEQLSQLMRNWSDFLWGAPMIILLFGTHIFLTIRLKGIQRHTFKAIKLSITKDDSSDGEISQFGALATALAATIGTGNIIGVSTAIALGGPGAVFWCWISGLFGMATKYGEALLSIQYRQKNNSGSFLGGPMMTIEKGLHCKPLAIIFALLTTLATFGAGCTVQSHAISGIMRSTFFIPEWFSGLIVTIIIGIVILGGVKSISRVCEKLVPFMTLFYILGCLMILAMNYHYIIPALGLIISSAFTKQSLTGGMIGGGLMLACRYGIARGLFSNESGLGTAPIAAASARTKNPVRQALVSMTGTFWDTVVVCAITGIVSVSSMLHYPSLFNNIASDKITEVSFSMIPYVGSIILAIALSIFAFTTILGWSYYGEQCMTYLFGNKSVIFYRVVFLIVLFIGAITSLNIIWNFSDLMNGLMAFPNLISLLLLSSQIVKVTKYFLWENHLDEETESIND